MLDDAMEEAINTYEHPLTAYEITQHIEKTKKVVLSTQNIANHVRTRPANRQRFKRIPDNAGENPRRKYLYDTIIPRPPKYPEPSEELIAIHQILNNKNILQKKQIINRLWDYIRNTPIFRTVDLGRQLRINRNGDRAIKTLSRLGLIKTIPNPYTIPPSYDSWSSRRRNEYREQRGLPPKFRTSLYYTYDPTVAIEKIDAYVKREKENLDMKRDHLVKYLTE